MDSVSASSQTQIDDLSNFDTYVRVAYGVENVKSELELYLEEKLIPRTDEFFDICNYWKVTGLKYPVLNMIAKDIFVVPISTVASESTFSTGGRHVGSHRARLHPSTLEALICTQNWLVNDKKGSDSTLFCPPHYCRWVGAYPVPLLAKAGLGREIIANGPKQ
ncbi:zinc finger BED domain-containing protein DAYSLEEPER-like [Humulus lupulus]|uniref:zinc finger BED domain-containing protein DAYSLEEPER-like n=1 Tax=Humulus lupulus TaxID=3486 RepID=UPI002B4026BC|nr:zinc finger BED domain-containing protein DAYSLEEPER-like [Humulus lupulus]